MIGVVSCFWFYFLQDWNDLKFLILYGGFLCFYNELWTYLVNFNDVEMFSIQNIVENQVICKLDWMFVSIVKENFH